MTRYNFIDQSCTLLTKKEDIQTFCKIIEQAGRTCYKSESNITDDSANSFVSRLIKNQHLSVLEHCSITVKVVTSRAIANEIVRHRIASYSQESTRYINYKNKPISFIKFNIPEHKEKDIKFFLDTTVYLYNLLIDNHSLPEDARNILPLCLATELVITMNIRSWLHFFDERLYNKKAHHEIRSLSKMIYQEFNSANNILFPDIQEL